MYRFYMILLILVCIESHFVFMLANLNCGQFLLSTRKDKALQLFAEMAPVLKCVSFSECDTNTHRKDPPDMFVG